MTNRQFRPGGFQILPPVIKNLLIINGLFFLAKISLNNVANMDLDNILGLHYFGAESFQPYQILTYMFMHADIGHIFFNMFALWMFGSAIENFWGPKRFLIYYLITGIGAAVLHYLVFYIEIQPTLAFIDNFNANPSNDTFVEYANSGEIKLLSQNMISEFNRFRITYNNLLTTDQGEALRQLIRYLGSYRTELLNAPIVVGASGSVFGLLLAFGMLFPNAMIYVYFAIPVKAKWFVAIYGAIEVYLGFANNPGDSVAHFAHLGGMIFGFIMIKIWKKKENNNRWT
jgi:membrane associated rhomboid family serine protease